MKCINATSLHRKSGQMGHPAFVAGGGKPQVPPLRYTPVGMPRGRVVAFVRCRQIGWTDRNSGPSTAAEVVTFRFGGRKALKSIGQRASSGSFDSAL
jgi:hypothetical protein